MCRRRASVYLRANIYITQLGRKPQKKPTNFAPNNPLASIYCKEKLHAEYRKQQRNSYLEVLQLTVQLIKSKTNLHAFTNLQLRTAEIRLT